MRAAWGCLALVAAAPRHEQQDALQSHQLKRWYDCVDPSGEAYGAAWLAHRDTVLAHRIDKKIAENTNMETGGWIPRELATPRQSVDLYDCGVEHLSWLERRIGLRGARRGQGDARRGAPGPPRRARGAAPPAQRPGAHGEPAPPLDRRRLPFFATSPDCGAQGRKRVIQVCFNVAPRRADRRARPRAQERRAWAPFHYVYYSEADQVLHVRDARRVIAVVDEGHYVSPHRMQPLAHPVDLPALAVKANQLWLPRWSRDDLRRIRNVGDYDNVTEVPAGAPHDMCCVGRALRRRRASWAAAHLVALEGRRPLRLVKYDGLAMIAAHQGNYGQLSSAAAPGPRAQRGPRCPAYGFRGVEASKSPRSGPAV
ncbi:hypothetical protein JL720_4444 [Aureococcus anophagefferens]|nr:hypothetical protein JL720_4444 [Aureococcus anophagefferens]